MTTLVGRSCGAVAAVILGLLSATALSATTPSPSATMTPTYTPTPTPTYTPTPTPTSCYGSLPVVKPVPAGTDQQQLVVYFCGRIAGVSSMSACSEAGCATDVSFGSGDPNCTVSCLATCNKGTVPLRAGQTNHIRVCQENGSCSAHGCVTNDLNGTPLVVQVAPLSPTPTVTPSATPTATGGPPCTGDCNGNSVVAINELVLGVNIVLGPQSVTACPAFANPQGMVDIAELLKGVNNALDGCGG